jgi:TolA-binding protein
LDGDRRYDDDKFREEPGNHSWNDPDYDGVFSANELGLFAEIGEYIQAVLDIEDVRSDPAYSSAADAAASITAAYKENYEGNPELERFIRDSLAEHTTDSKLRDEIDRIKHEADHSNVDGITSGWVKEWLDKKDKNEGEDPRTEKIREFITGSLNQEESVFRERPEDKGRKISGKSLIISYTSLAAAVVIGAVFLIRSLLTTGDTQKLFTRYYEPFNAVSAVTRGTGTNGNLVFNRAVESYKSGDYPAAEAGFSEAMLNESTSLPASFFLGITEIELKNTGKAIKLLGGVANRQGEYAKEATWYLGLVYIKTSNKIKARECFELLAQSPGFYSDRSEKILRRLR